MIDEDAVKAGEPDAKPHETHLATWDLPAPVVVNSQWKAKVGAKCMAGCPLAGQEIDVHNEAGHCVATAKLGQTPWPQTTGLYWAELDLVAPEQAGTHLWTIRLEANLDVPHAQTTPDLGFVTVGSPDVSVAVELFEEDTRVPIVGAEVRLGVYRACTNDHGMATVDVTKGTYDLKAWKSGYELQSRSLEVDRDLAVALGMSVAIEPEESYWM